MAENKETKKQLEILGVDMVGLLTQILSSANKYATGQLIQSLNFRVIERANELLLEIMAADYFKYVDEGRRPGKQPPIKPIQSWVDRKGIVIGNLSKKQTAFVIARSIGKNGIRPLNAKDKAIREVMRNADKILRKGATKDIATLLEKTYVKEIENEMSNYG